MAYAGEKVQVKLVGQDGNAFAIMGRVTQAMRRAGMCSETIKEYESRATSGDYDNLLRVTLEYVEEPPREDDWEDDDEDEDDSFTCPGCGGLFYESEEDPHHTPVGIMCNECYREPCPYCGGRKEPLDDYCDTCEPEEDEEEYYE